MNRAICPHTAGTASVMRRNALVVKPAHNQEVPTAYALPVQGANEICGGNAALWHANVAHIPNEN